MLTIPDKRYLWRATTVYSETDIRGGKGGVNEMGGGGGMQILIPNVTGLNIQPCSKDRRTDPNSVDPHKGKHKTAETVDAHVFLVSVAETDSAPRSHDPTLFTWLFRRRELQVPSKHQYNKQNEQPLHRKITLER